MCHYVISKPSQGENLQLLPQSQGTLNSPHVLSSSQQPHGEAQAIQRGHMQALW